MISNNCPPNCAICMAEDIEEDGYEHNSSDEYIDIGEDLED
jgi:hypothetical protein